VIISRIMRWVGHVVPRGAYRVWWETWRKESLGGPRRRWGIILRRTSWKWDGGMEWTHLAQDRDRWLALVDVVMILWVSWNVGNILTSWEPVSFSRSTLFHGVSK
jgi:hypothetical protein